MSLEAFEEHRLEAYATLIFRTVEALAQNNSAALCQRSSYLG
jgi:hypothetical protein